MTARRALGKRRLEALIEEAIVDAYGEFEQRVGFLCISKVASRISVPTTAAT
jgi:hypothetical protein